MVHFYKPLGEKDARNLERILKQLPGMLRHKFL